MNRILIISLIYLIPLSTSAQKVQIIGYAPSYNNNVLAFYSYDDFITNTPLLLGNVLVDSSGSFSLSFDQSETIPVYIDLGVYNCNFFCEPNTSYIISIPEKKNKTIEEKLNPFFESVDVYAGIKDEKSKLNYSIRKFDEAYESYIDAYQLDISLNAYKSNVDTFINIVDSVFINTSEYFTNYKEYRFAQLLSMAYERNVRFVIKKYFLNKPILYNNVAYMDFFNFIFHNYLDYYSKTKEGERIFYDIAYGKSPSYAMQTLDNEIVLANDTLRELVLLKGLNDAFLNPDWPAKSLLQTIDSIILTSRISEHRKIAHNIKSKMTGLQRGFPAPDFELYSQDSVLKSLADYNGKYLYVNFFALWSFECKKQMESLKQLQDNYRKYLNIITISCEGNFNEAKQYFKDNGYSWDLINFSNQEEILKKYNIKVFPTYYLIDKTGNLLMCPAPTPEDNFELYLINVLKSSRN